jgi:serine/threonine-protein kinase
MDTPESLAISGNAPTLEVPSGAASWGTADACEPRLCGRFGLVEGSLANLTVQTLGLLRARLRTVAAFHFCAFSILLLWNLSTGGAGGIDIALEFPSLLRFHVLEVIVLGATCVVLFQHQPLPRWALGAAEIIVFGLPAAFFADVNYQGLKYSTAAGHPPLNLLTPWLCIILMYSMFIPNTARRAALVVGTLAAAPILLMLGVRVEFPEVCAVIPLGLVGENALVMGLTAVGAVLGTHMIGSLRQQVFEARQLGQYRLMRLLGSGGMGNVYLAEHQLLKRPCAIKVIRPGQAADPQAIARFEREVQTTATLTHPNTIEIYDYGRTDDGTFYYVMEYLPGLSMADLVARHGPVPAERVIFLLRQACDALREAHSAGLIHRDIKPGNIFVAERGGVYDVVKLLDFGLAKGSEGSEGAQITQEGTVAGSPMFMSPEQALGQPSDARGDIYSLGAVGYFLLTGQPPFQGTTAMELIVAHARDPVAPLTQLRPEVPPDVERLILRCLAKEPDERFQSALSLDEALAACESAGRWSLRSAALWWREQGLDRR